MVIARNLDWLLAVLQLHSNLNVHPKEHVIYIYLFNIYIRIYICINVILLGFPRSYFFSPSLSSSEPSRTPNLNFEVSFIQPLAQ